MKVLGVGLSRTGTFSLALALRELGFNTLHYDRVRLNDVLDGTAPAPIFAATTMSTRLPTFRAPTFIESFCRRTRPAKRF